MPRVHTQKAAKDYPEHGIKKGDTYYKWSFRYGGTYMSKEYPKPSQLTQSKLSGAYAASEALDAGLSEASCPEDIVSLIEDAISDIQSVADEYREAKENMPENLQDSPTAQDCEEKADNLEAWIEDLESVKSEIEDFGSSDIVDLLELTEAPVDEDGDPKFKLESVTFDDLDDEQQATVLEHLTSLVFDQASCPV